MELDRIVPNNIMSGGPEDLGLIEMLWKQDVDLGVGKEVYDHSLREEMERKKELEYYKRQEQLKAQSAAREKEVKSKQEECSRWLQQNFMRDGETGEWVKRHNKTTNKNNGSAGLAPVEEESDDSLTLEAALDYLTSSVDPNDFVSGTEEMPVGQTFTGDMNIFQGGAEMNGQAMQQLHQPEEIQHFLSQDNLESEWSEVEQYLNISLSEPASAGMRATSQDFNVDVAIDTKLASNVMTNLEDDLPQMVESNLFTTTDLPLIQDATLPSPEIEPVPELGSVTLTNSSVPPQPCAMNTSLDWELGNLSFFGNLTVLPEGNIDDIDLQGMEYLFNTMSEANDLTNLTTPDMNNLVMNGGLNETSASLNTTSFTEELNDAFSGLEGATGGADFSSGDGFDVPYRKISRLSESSSDSGFNSKGGFSSSSSSSSSSYAGSPIGGDSSMAHNSTNSNDTDHDPNGTQALAHQVAHNHTYNTLPGHVPREVKKYAPKENTKKGPQCRDEKRAHELKIPFTMDQIIDSPVETFNDILTKYSLNEEQLNLIRDIRRRGKNKLAAQNCRKRKVGVIVTLSDEMIELQKARDRLRAERAEMEKETRRMKEKFGHLYTHIFQSLRDEHGQPYNPNLYSLQQSSDGNVFLVPRNTSANGINGHNSSRQNDASRIKKRRSDN